MKTFAMMLSAVVVAFSTLSCLDVVSGFLPGLTRPTTTTRAPPTTRPPPTTPTAGTPPTTPTTGTPPTTPTTGTPPTTPTTPTTGTPPTTPTTPTTGTPPTTRPPPNNGSDQGASAQAGPWRKATLTQYISYPDCCEDENADQDECENYKGCEYAGYCAFLDDQQTKQWVEDNDIISVHSKDSDYKLKTLELRKNGRTHQGKVYDRCDDDDCENCCTDNLGEGNFLIDLEKYTYERFGQEDGVIEWRCLDC